MRTTAVLQLMSGQAKVGCFNINVRVIDSSTVLELVLFSSISSRYDVLSISRRKKLKPEIGLTKIMENRVELVLHKLRCQLSLSTVCPGTALKADECDQYTDLFRINSLLVACRTWLVVANK